MEEEEFRRALRAGFQAALESALQGAVETLVQVGRERGWIAADDTGAEADVERLRRRGKPTVH